MQIRTFFHYTKLNKTIKSKRNKRWKDYTIETWTDWLSYQKGGKRIKRRVVFYGWYILFIRFSICSNHLSSPVVIIQRWERCFQGKCSPSSVSKNFDRMFESESQTDLDTFFWSNATNFLLSVTSMLHQFNSFN